VAPRRSESRARARGFLVGDDLEGLAAWAEGETASRQAVFSLLCDPDPAVAGRAAEALGRFSAIDARDDLETVRERIRRLLWSMNDEAGACIPLAPRAIGAILVHVPFLIGEYTDILASFAEIDPFRAEVRKALERIVGGPTKRKP
jgi:hypothetical protein